MDSHQPSVVFCEETRLQIRVQVVLVSETGKEACSQSTPGFVYASKSSQCLRGLMGLELVVGSRLENSHMTRVAIETFQSFLLVCLACI